MTRGVQAIAALLGVLLGARVGGQAVATWRLSIDQRLEQRQAQGQHQEITVHARDVHLLNEGVVGEGDVAAD